MPPPLKVILFGVLLPALAACGGAPSQSLPGPCSSERLGLQGEVLESMTYEYRFDGRLIRRSGPGDDDQIRFFYDGDSRFKLVDFPGTNPELSLRYEYDGEDRVASIERHLGTGKIVERTLFEYGRDDRIQFREEKLLDLRPESIRVDYRYDAAGRLIEEATEIGPSVRYVYVEQGVLRHKDESALRTIYEFDEFGNVLGETVVSAHDETAIKQQWLYEYGCWNEKSASERNAPRTQTEYLSSTVR
jgi:YD repeat-containing protein